MPLYDIFLARPPLDNDRTQVTVVERGEDGTRRVVHQVEIWDDGLPPELLAVTLPGAVLALYHNDGSGTATKIDLGRNPTGARFAFHPDGRVCIEVCHHDQALDSVDVTAKTQFERDLMMTHCLQQHFNMHVHLLSITSPTSLAKTAPIYFNFGVCG